MELGKIRIEVVQGDITKQDDIACIVNAANAELQIGGGVAGAIHTAAGEELIKETQKLAPIRTGQAVITGAHNLPNQQIIHTLGPVYGFNQPEMGFLTDCYKNSLHLAEENNINSIAFPAISTGAFGYPFEEATDIALSVIKEFSTKADSIKLIRFVLFSPSDYEYYVDKLKDFRLI
ncbi:macro domain-containing protein [Marivirga harenae]|uniref:macro domain-containing protein n=1 Tax=Marivirga harenae TaxID=2010992 RepID=UPI0026E0FA8D|nr:macro domain-containing protein [Marivirga harenae]WKV13966.1 macro domain-containing protein [Marivirga harenae]